MFPTRDCGVHGTSLGRGPWFGLPSVWEYRLINLEAFSLLASGGRRQQWPVAAAGFVGQARYPVLQKPLRPFVYKAPADPDHGGDLDEGHAISQQENNPPTPGASRRDGGRPLPRQQRLAVFRREADREGGFPATRHTVPSITSCTC